MTSPPALPTPDSDHVACGNCGTPLHGKYCYECGQPIEGLVRHFGSVMGDVMDSVLNIDARIVHTLLPLYFRPGVLTLNYFAGKRARYVTPFRLVFFLAIIAFLAIQLLLRTDANHFVMYQASPTVITSASAPAEKQDTHFADGNITFDDKVVWNRQTKPWHVAAMPEFVNDWLNDSIENARNNLHHLNSGNAAETKTTAQHLMGGLLGVAPQVLFVLLPVFALMLKLFYVFKRRLYMEHLIVAMHSHAFIMLSLLVLVTLDLLSGLAAAHVPWLASVFGMLRTAAWIWMLVYLLIMQKRVYRQGWFMTTLKYCVIGICYSVLISVGTVFALLVSLGSA
ncbi:DUF3667 domain-containing protein [Rhodanobacter sp. L36]|uniref:DUF3667 domain-containing protein n=1 Tax=Rhodanobacter sp. L36 TaxID=1747221 RepID=UPI00131D7C47|nr:DUF3667 domain-containing protein [Rhodanobacter sp. L36]